MDYKSFSDKLRASPRPVVVDFWAPWCLPCRAIEPALKQLEAEHADQVAVWRLNADEHIELLSALSIYGIPTLIAFREGREVLRQNGAQSRASLTRLFEAARMGTLPVESGLPWFERALRAAAGVGLAALGWINGPNLVLVGLGGLIAFSAVYDRCPLWRALAPRLGALIRGRALPRSE